MKKYLIIGLCILITTNAIVLAGVTYNRSETTSQLLLTERELPLNYMHARNNHNSSVSVSIKWRTPIPTFQEYQTYTPRNHIVTKEEFEKLGFNAALITKAYGNESKELYWVLEHEGDLHQAALQKAQEHYKQLTSVYEEAPTKENRTRQLNAKKLVEREKHERSRLFFKEASASLEELSSKYANQHNMIIVKGITKPQYFSDKQEYRIALNRLSISQIMLPLDQASALKNLKYNSSNKLKKPRYSVNVDWGLKLEPWVNNVTLLAQQ